MKYSKLLALGTMAAGLILGGATATAEAQDRDWYRYENRYTERQDLRRDYDRVSRLRAAIANDRYRLEEDRRFGRRWATERDARDLARHQYELERCYRDIRSDRRW